MCQPQRTGTGTRTEIGTGIGTWPEQLTIKTNTSVLYLVSCLWWIVVCRTVCLRFGISQKFFYTTIFTLLVLLMFNVCDCPSLLVVCPQFGFGFVFFVFAVFIVAVSSAAPKSKSHLFADAFRYGDARVRGVGWLCGMHPGFPWKITG